ncbi:MAG TPA: hypothetical protein VLS26_05690, partial [Azonexus sp.]|nr:hypothetical protein [Azonexus sp.]
EDAPAWQPHAGFTALAAATGVVAAGTETGLAEVVPFCAASRGCVALVLAAALPPAKPAFP